MGYDIQRFFEPPRMLPNTPRMISRPTLDPMLRIADLAAASARPSCLPPRGPVLPNSTSFNPPSKPPPSAAGGAAAVPAVPVGKGAGALLLDGPFDDEGVGAGEGAVGLAAARPLSFS